SSPLQGNRVTQIQSPAGSRPPAQRRSQCCSRSIQSEVKTEHVDSSFAQKSEIRRFRVRSDKFHNQVRGQSTDSSYTSDLEFRVAHASVGIPSAGRGGDRVRRHSIGFLQTVFFAISLDTVLDRVVQFLRGRAEIAAPGAGCIVAIAGGGGAR